MAFAVTTRSLSGDLVSYEDVEPLASFEKAIAVEQERESFVEWYGLDQLACVDLDVDAGSEIDEARLLLLLERFMPKPSVSWVTHGGGLRLVYVLTELFTAEEICAIAAMNLGDTVLHSSIEIKHATRHPLCTDRLGRRCGAVHRRKQEVDVRSFRTRLGIRIAEDSDVQAWLEHRGFEVGGRYDHPRCPVSPSDRGGRRPVSVLDSGVQCFVCEAEGICAGSSRAGFFPYSYLCGDRTRTDLYRMLEAGCHWEHARMLVSSLLGRYAKQVYTAGVTMFRGREDSLRCLVSGRDFVRIGDRWTNLCGEPYSGDVKPILASLPACSFRTEEGAVKADRAKVVMFEQSFDLAKYGYRSLTPVYGCRIRKTETEAVAVVQIRDLAGDERTNFRPHLRNGMPEADMWKTFEESCPGLNRNLLLLLVAARGFAEEADCMPPMVFVTGPTGSSKTLSSFLAASVCGDRNTEIVWTNNGDRLRQAVVDAATCGTFVTFNEVLKESRRHLKAQNQAMDFVLNLTPDSMSHYMYVGPVRMGRLPVFVWTDTGLPQQIKTDAQLARRIVHVEMSKQVDWERSLQSSGVGHPRRFRLSSQRRADACNNLLAYVSDRFFSVQSTFEKVAAELGFGRMSESSEAEEGRDALVRLFEAVCSSPDVSGPDAVRWKGRGWKMVQQDVQTPLRDVWAEIADEDRFEVSRRATEVDWQRLLSLAEPCRLETRVHGAKIAMRFRSVEGEGVRFNGELR